MKIQSEFSASVVKSQWMKALRVLSFVLIGAIAQGSLAQTSTVLNFDAFADGTVITNQYSAQGITATGVTVLNASSVGLPTNSSPNFAFAPTGLMVFNISIANVKTISAFVTGPADIGMFGYDASNNLVASLITAVPTNNQLMSITSSGAAITRLEIHDGGATFLIDDLTFTVPATVNICRATDQAAYDLVSALPLSAYIRSKTASLDRVRIMAEIAEFEKLRLKGTSQKLLSAALVIIQSDVKLSIKSPQNQPILAKLSELALLIKNNACQ